MNRKKTSFVHLKIRLHNYESEGDIKNKLRSKVLGRSTVFFFSSIVSKDMQLAMFVHAV